MTREQRDELRRLASAGPRGSTDDGWIAQPDGVVDRSGTVVCGDCLPSDARFIAAANPSAVLALLDALDAAEARAADARRAALEEAAKLCDQRAVEWSLAVMRGDAKHGNWAASCADAIYKLAASDHAVEDTDDCFCGACLGGETCAERD